MLLRLAQVSMTLSWHRTSNNSPSIEEVEPTPVSLYWCRLFNYSEGLCSLSRCVAKNEGRQNEKEGVLIVKFILRLQTTWRSLSPAFPHHLLPPHAVALS